MVDEAGNLVGIIEEAGANWSTMITITDATLEMGALIARTDSTAVLEGDFTLMAEGKLKLTYLPENTELITGDLVLTSSMGATTPPGWCGHHRVHSHRRLGYVPLRGHCPAGGSGRSGTGVYHQSV